VEEHAPAGGGGEELAPLLLRVAEALERLVETTAAIAAKLDRANETLEHLDRSQWG
jgi:hypothetical protein